MRRSRRVIAGFLIAPLVPGATAIIVGFGAIAVAALDGAPYPYSSDVGFLALLGVFMVPISLVAAVLFGIPLYLMLNRIGRVSVIYAVLGGLLIGTIMSPIVELTLLNRSVDQISMRIWPWSAGGAVLASLAFWFIARPDRADANRAASGER